jgi:23S rRNA pseudouridine1911/1915/1917 synthase
LSKSNSVSTPERFHWLIPKDLAGTVRADSLLKRNLPGLSKRSRGELFSKNCVRINGRPVAKGFRACPGDFLEIELPEPLSPFQVSDQVLRPLVVFEDHSLLVVVKPGLVPTHPLSPLETATLANALIAHWPQIIGVGSKPLEPGLVHRLDNGTSGLLVVALTHGAWLRLKKDLTARRWEKTYRALVEGILLESMTISLPLAHDPTDKRKMKVIRGPQDTRRGRVYRALTQVRPLTCYKNTTLIEVQLITGVTHQIRAHLAFRGHPVIGDALYGSQAGEKLGLSPGRFFLHAYQLSFPHPITGKKITCTSELPEDLQRVLSHIENLS